MLSKRTNILFDEALWRELYSYAKRKERSVGEVVRSAVHKQLEEEQILEKRKAALKEIERIRPHFKGKIDYKALINYGRTR